MKIENFFAGMNISAFGLAAQRRKMNAVAMNMANAETTRTEAGGPYKRVQVVLQSANGSSFGQQLAKAASGMAQTSEGHLSGGLVTMNEGEVLPGTVSAFQKEIKDDYRMVYEPEHPDADKDGYVKYPNINVVTEMVDMISASRAYEANITAVNAAKTMAKDTLEI